MIAQKQRSLRNFALAGETARLNFDKDVDIDKDMNPAR